MIRVLPVMVPATLTGQDSQTANQAEARKVIQDGHSHGLRADRADLGV